MRPYFTHTLEPNGEEVFTQSPSDSLAIVDLESYKAFVGSDADRLDLMAHLCHQTSALTAMVWGTPGKALRLRFILTGDYHALEQMTQSNRSASASGWVRTHSGRLGLISHDQLYDCARDRSRDPLGGASLPKLSRPHLLNVLPGVYSVHVFYDSPIRNGYGGEVKTSVAPEVHSTVILRHYAFPAPRLTPMRLPGFMPQAA